MLLFLFPSEKKQVICTNLQMTQKLGVTSTLKKPSLFFY